MNHLLLAVLTSAVCCSVVNATEIRILEQPKFHSLWTQAEITAMVQQVINAEDFREVRVQVFPRFLVIQFFQIGYHRVDFIRVNFNQKHEIITVQSPYAYTAEDLKLLDQRDSYACPDNDAQVIAFAPNNDSIEQAVTLDVIQAAEAKGYKVVSLLKAQATRLNYLSYMTCPHLIGNFYDGDSNPQSFITVDGLINASELSAMKGIFRYHVTNIWVACEAFNDPMYSTLINDTQTQKYAAGINDLLVGPSDQAAACAMKAAIAGQPMTQSFQDCYHQLDTPNDKWGFDGHGSDIFGQ